MTREERERLRVLCEVATKKPWRINNGDSLRPDGQGLWHVGTPCAGILPDDQVALVSWQDDAAFIAAARTALPELLDALEAVEAQLREVVGQAKQQLRDEQEASGVDLGKIMRRQDRMVAEMTVLRQRAEAAEASVHELSHLANERGISLNHEMKRVMQLETKLAAIVAVMGTPGDYCYECATMMGVSPHTLECQIGRVLGAGEVTG